MAQIKVLDKLTIDKIAAGEVVERPGSVVKELVENAIDAGATAVTVEIKGGGIDLIRVTDNGCGIPKEEVRTAFLRHATSKIDTDEDLSHIDTLGFRGEALSSISAVTQLEVITKRAADITGTSYEIRGGEEIGLTEIGAPNGTTFLVKNLFYNTPARRKYLKTAITEANHVEEVVEKLALSHPDVSFRFLNNGNTRLSTTGNGKVKDLIYAVFGRETANEVTELQYDDGVISMKGYIGKPVLAKGNRSFENYFVNGRYVKSELIRKAIEEAYQPFMMQHRYPFTVFYITMDPETFDVNVHPTKMELRFSREALVFDTVLRAIRQALSHKEFVPDMQLNPEKPETKKYERAPEPFETKRSSEWVREQSRYKVDTEKFNEIERPVGKLRGGNVAEQTTRQQEEVKKPVESGPVVRQPEESRKPVEAGPVVRQPEESRKPVEAGPVVRQSEESRKPVEAGPVVRQPEESRKPVEATAGQPDDLYPTGKPVQQDMTTQLLSEAGMKRHRLIGQVFRTYWLIELEDKLYIMDQHAAHEKVLYERRMKELSERKQFSQNVSPPIMVSLSSREEMMLNRYMDAFSELGYEVSSFGGREYAISAVPNDVYGLDVKELFKEILSDMTEDLSVRKPEMILSKLASLSCKAAVKGNNEMSFEEADHLIKELLTLQNPYACPHGRPTLISMTRQDLEKKFKRIV